jgi:hypothetical protein
MLQVTHPGRDYTTSLLTRRIKSGKEFHFGKDPHCMTKFLEAGFEIRANGGVFKFEIDQSQRLKSVMIQVSLDANANVGIVSVVTRLLLAECPDVQICQAIQ